MKDRTEAMAAILNAAPVIPVLVVEDAASAVPLARALVAGGIATIEVTLRTPAAEAAMRAIRAEVEGAVVGAGTVLTPLQVERAVDAGAAFLVSPGSTPDLLHEAEDAPIPFLPGAATATEAMLLAERGYRYLKFFPAEPAGGAAYLKALASPLPDIAFCPTGGISAASAPAYLALPNVVCVGGSWLAPPAAVAAGDWAAVTALAKAAAGLKGAVAGLRRA
jgi:2-dehydro-3-deoxyphosphogluconate aldolase/(4S)-4-hydroxy-2-oxoglutarate aldolase